MAQVVRSPLSPPRASEDASEPPEYVMSGKEASASAKWGSLSTGSTMAADRPDVAHASLSAPKRASASITRQVGES